MTTTIERLEQIENERMETQSNPDYQNWVRELNVSRMHIDRAGMLKAKEIMSMWGNSILNKSIFANIKTNRHE